MPFTEISVLFSRHTVRILGNAAQLLGFVVMGCGDSAALIERITIPSDDGAGGASATGHGGSSSGSSGSGSSGSGSSGSGAGGNGVAGSAGVGGTSVGGTGSVAGTGGSGNVGGAAGSGSVGGGGSGGTRGELGYQPVGIGDPWFFDSEAELEAFAVELAGGASGSAVWNAAGEIHLSTAFTAGGDKAMLHFTAPWDSLADENTTLDLTHRVLKARVRVAHGATVEAGLQLYSQSGSWSWVAGDWCSFSSLSGFTELELDLDASTDPSHVLRFGMQVYANGAGHAELIIDDVRLEPRDEPAAPGDAGPEADAGVGGNDAGDSGVPDAGASADAGGGGPG